MGTTTLTRDRTMADIVDSALKEQQVDTRTPLGASTTPRAFAKADLRPVQELFGLTPTSTCNTVFIAIDFENIANIEEDLLHDLDCEVGLASSTQKTSILCLRLGLYLHTTSLRGL